MNLRTKGQLPIYPESSQVAYAFGGEMSDTFLAAPFFISGRPVGRESSDQREKPTSEGLKWNPSIHASMDVFEVATSPAPGPKLCPSLAPHSHDAHPWTHPTDSRARTPLGGPGRACLPSLPRPAAAGTGALGPWAGKCGCDTRTHSLHTSETAPVSRFFPSLSRTIRRVTKQNGRLYSLETVTSLRGWRQLRWSSGTSAFRSSSSSSFSSSTSIGIRWMTFPICLATPARATTSNRKSGHRVA